MPEINTGIKWVDNSPIYQITFASDSGYTSSDSIDLSSLGFDKIISINAYGADDVPYANNSKWTIASAGGGYSRYIYVDTNNNLRFGSAQRIVFAVTLQYTKLNYHLPNSNASDILCSASYEDFINGAQSWGKGSMPVAFNGTGATINTTDNCVAILGSSYAHIDSVTGELNTGWTAYFVMRGGSGSYDDGSRYFNTGGWNANHDMIAVCINRQLNMGAWTTDTATGVPADDFFVVGVSFYRTGDPSVSGPGKMIVYDPSEGECKIAFDDSIYLTTANLYWGHNPGSYSSSCDMDAKFIGLVNTAESQETIEANIEYLYNHFISNS